MRAASAPGEPAQGGGLPGERLIVPALGRALEDAGHLGQEVGPAAGKVAEFGHRGGLLALGEVAPAGVVPGGSGELSDEEPVSGRRKMILAHLARIERVSGYLKWAGELSRQSRGGVAVGSDIPGQAARDTGHAAQMPLAEDQHVARAVAAERSASLRPAVPDEGT
jgi:hypothetical protein